jgi:hypothetical protein
MIKPLSRVQASLTENLLSWRPLSFPSEVYLLARTVLRHYRAYRIAIGTVIYRMADVLGDVSLRG